MVAREVHSGLQDNILDPRTGKLAKAWVRFFEDLKNTVNSGDISIPGTEDNIVSLTATGGLQDSGEPTAGLVHSGDTETITGDWTFSGDVTLSGLTASRLMQTDASKNASSVADLTSWIAGTANQITSTSDGDGTLTLSTPQDIHTGASPTWVGATISGLGISDPVYTNLFSALTTTAPTSGIIGYWGRTGTSLYTTDLTDTVSLGGTLTVGTVEIMGLTTGNVKIGDSDTLGSLTSGLYNIGIGHDVFEDLEDGNYNIGLGRETLENLVSSSNNIGIGYRCGRMCVAGANNVFLGTRAGEQCLESNNVFIGPLAGQDTTTGTQNYFSGAQSGTNNVGGSYNAFLGPLSGFDNNGGDENVFIGRNSGYANNDGNLNCYLGSYSGRYNVDGSNNVFIGPWAGFWETAASNSLYIDNIARTNLADAKVKALIYGTFAATTAAQELHFNSNVEVLENLSIANFGEARFYDDGANYVGFEAPALSADQIWKLPATDGDADDIIKTDGSGALAFVTATVDVPMVISMYEESPSKNTIHNWNGGMLSLSAGDTLSNGDNIVVTKGTGKIVLVVNASNDAIGDITITGDSVNRDTGVVTGADTDTITLAGNSTDNSTTGGKGGGAVIYEIDDAYITNKWFTGSVTLSTTEVDLTDVDVYHVSFEQWNDQTNLTLNTFDANIFTTNTAAEFDAYLFTLHKDAGSKCHIDHESSLHVGADGETAIADKYWRLRRGDINEALNGATDGFWIDIWYLNAGNVYVEDVTVKVWATKAQTLILA